MTTSLLIVWALLLSLAYVLLVAAATPVSLGDPEGGHVVKVRVRRSPDGSVTRFQE